MLFIVTIPRPYFTTRAASRFCLLSTLVGEKSFAPKMLIQSFLLHSPAFYASNDKTDDDRVGTGILCTVPKVVKNFSNWILNEKEFISLGICFFCAIRDTNRGRFWFLYSHPIAERFFFSVLTLLRGDIVRGTGWRQFNSIFCNFSSKTPAYPMMLSELCGGESASRWPNPDGKNEENNEEFVEPAALQRFLCGEAC